MRYDPERCAHCGGPPIAKGRMWDDAPFFFCSQECFDAELNRFMPTELSLSKTVENDPRFKSLMKEYETLRERLYLDGELLSNEEIAERDTFDAEQQAIIQTFADAWNEKQLRAIEDAKEQIKAAWYAHHEQLSAQEDQRERQERELREREEEALAETIKPRPIPEHLRIHTAIIAKTGWGKTQLLQHLTVAELHKSDPPSLVILDSTGAMVERMQKLAVFNEHLSDRLLIIDPAHSPALNMFDVSNPRFNTYTPEQKESVQADVIGLFNYIFSSKDYDLSGQQGLGFIYAVRLILTCPGYTVTDLRHLLEEAPKTWEQSAFADDIRELDQDAREFFQHHFYSDSLKATKAAIARRLHALIAIPTFRRMFTAGSNVLDLYSETQDKGSIILVNTNQHLLGRDGYLLFGRYVVARTMAAMLERAHIPQHQRRTTHLLIDEAAPYFDDSFDDLLTQLRQYGLKVTIAFQHLDQLADKLRNSVAGQTSVKYIGGMSPIDERRVAAQIRCEPEFISGLALDISYPPQWSEWAVYADGFTRHPMKMRLPFYTLENEPRMTDDQHAAIVARNIARVASKTDTISKESSHPPGVSSTELRGATGPDVSQPPGKPEPPQPSSSSDDPHTGKHSEPASKWGRK